jgi:hypothetical protein
MKKLFDSTQELKYTEASAGNEANALIEAKANL